MDIIQYTPDILTPLTEFYNRLTAEVPFCYPVNQKEFSLVVQNVDTDKYNQGEGGRFGEKVYMAISDDNVKAFIHVGISLKSENEEEDVGFSHSTHYRRGRGLCFVADALFSQENTRLNSAPQRLLSQPLARRQLSFLTRDFQTDAVFSNVLS